MLTLLFVIEVLGQNQDKKNRYENSAEILRMKSVYFQAINQQKTTTIQVLCLFFN